MVLAHKRLKAARALGGAYSSVNEASAALLLVNSNNYQAWNERYRDRIITVRSHAQPILTRALFRRKRLVVAGHIDCASDLHFNRLVLGVHCAAGPAWQHRRWLLGRLPLDPATTDGMHAYVVAVTT